MNNLEQKLKALEALHPKKIDLTLGRIERLLAALGNPQRRLPPIIHVAGTNGKGSTVAFLRAMFEAAGMRVHAYTSPHLIAFNERIRLAGVLVDDETLLKVFDEVEAANAGEPITFFEITTAAAFVLFARVPADVLLLEVGLGGRLDATNVITPAACVITRISRDHTEFLGSTIEQIAAEKGGIMKPHVPCVVGYQTQQSVRDVLRAHAADVGCQLIEYGKDFWAEEHANSFDYSYQNETQTYPLPALLGAHQILNASAAITAAKLFCDLSDDHIRAGLRNVEWPGRLQRITAGWLAEKLPPGSELWVDGAHNDSGAEALAEQCRRWKAQNAGRPIHLVFAMQRHKDAAAFWAGLAPHISSLTVLPVPGHDSWRVEALSEIFRTTPQIPQAAEWETLTLQPGINLMAGSLYLASKVEL